jgi:TPR repeat protein
MYENGFAVPKDDLAAMGFYTMAARAGETQAAINLAFMLIEGPEAYRDPVEGYAWCLYVADRTDPDNKPGYEADCRALREMIDQESADAAVKRVADW